MPMALWRRLADQIAAVAPRTECWFSFCGEPLLEPDLLGRMLRYGKWVGLESLNVNTNGLLLTEPVAASLLESGVDVIVIGIDSFTKATYEAARVGSDWDIVYANVERLIAMRRQQADGPEIQVQFIAMADNAHEIQPFSNYWLERGASLKVRNQLSWGGKFETVLSVPAKDRIPCPWALTMMHVFWDGRVPRCPGDTEGDESVGNRPAPAAAGPGSVRAGRRPLGLHEVGQPVPQEPLLRVPHGLLALDHQAPATPSTSRARSTSWAIVRDQLLDGVEARACRGSGPRRTPRPRRRTARGRRGPARRPPPGARAAVEGRVGADADRGRAAGCVRLSQAAQPAGVDAVGGRGGVPCGRARWRSGSRARGRAGRRGPRARAR